MREFVNLIRNFAHKNDMVCIVDSSYGLNTTIDQYIADKGSVNDKDTLFYNIMSTGVMQIVSDRKYDITHTFEVGIFRRAIKEDDSENYFVDLASIIDKIEELFIFIYREFDVQNATYDVGLGDLDMNCVSAKMTVSVIEHKTMC